MYTLVKKLLTTKYIVRSLSLDVKVKPSVEKWDLFAGVSLERLPIITRDYNEFEVKYSNLLSRIEFENSLKSNFEIRLENDLKREKELKESSVHISDIDSAPQQTAQDFLDACNEELKLFKLGERVGDEKNMKSVNRALDRRLALIVKEKLGEQEHWIFPQGIYKGEESLRLTAERVLRDKCGDNINVKFLGNCPCGFYKYKYPKTLSGNAVGAKIFFFKAQYVNGQVDQKISGDFQWATRHDLTLLPNKYYKSIIKFLIPEEH